MERKLQMTESAHIQEDPNRKEGKLWHTCGCLCQWTVCLCFTFSLFKIYLSWCQLQPQVWTKRGILFATNICILGNQHCCDPTRICKQTLHTFLQHGSFLCDKHRYFQTCIQHCLSKDKAKYAHLLKQTMKCIFHWQGFSYTQNWQCYKTVKTKKLNHETTDECLNPRSCFVSHQLLSHLMRDGLGLVWGRWWWALTNQFTVMRIRWNTHIL